MMPKIFAIPYLKGLLRKVPQQVQAPLNLVKIDKIDKLALISSSGVHLKSDAAFDVHNRRGDTSFRRFPIDAAQTDLQVSHPHYDTRGVSQDINIYFPIRACLKLVDKGVIGALHTTAYSFMGFMHDLPGFVAGSCQQITAELRQAGVGAALLTPG